MAFNQKRASSSSSSFAASINPRRQSSYGHIMAGTGGLPSSHTAAIKAANAAAAAAAVGSGTTANGHSSTSSTTTSSASVASTSSTSNGSKRLSTSGFNLRNHHVPQHRNQSLKARVARTCPFLIHGPPRRRRNLFVMLCIGGVVVLIFIMSILEVSISPSSVMERSSSLLQQRSSSSSSGNTPPLQAEQVVEYKNPDGTDMDPKSIFMVRDFGASQCKAAFGEATLESTLPTEVRRERDEARATTWANTTKQNAYTLSLSWKRAMKTILPNWKEYTLGWVGQGVVLAPFPDRDGKDTIANTLVQIKLIRSMSTIPIEVWFETVQDVSEELHETLASWGAVVRTLDEDESIVRDGVVQLTNHEVDPMAVVPSGETPLTSIEVNDLRWKIGRNRAQHQRGLTVAALINSGFEEIVYYSPSTLPMQSPKSIFQQPDYIRTGALFWQHPTSFPAHDNPIWKIAQVDCNPTTFQQSWSAIALKHKDAWKGLFLAWHWLSGEEHATYEAAFGSQGHDLLRLAWMAVKRPYAMIERMPQPGAGIGKIELLDLSQAKGEGIGCNLGSSLYPTPGSDVLVNPFQFAKDQYLQKKRGKTDQDDFTPNRNVMLLDTSPDSAVINAGSNDRTIHNALDLALKDSRQPTTLLLTDVYAAGSGGRVCLKISQRRKGHRHV